MPSKKKIIVYRGKGADLFSVSSLLFALKQEGLEERFSIELCDKEFFKDLGWHKKTRLLIFPGGRDIPYHQALQGNKNQSIIDFVQNGGSFLGICAGGYFGSAAIEFERDGPLEVLGSRELKFFPGIARGPAYGPGKFSYRNQCGAQIAKLIVDSVSISSTSAAYYNGGCAFVDAEAYERVSILARYSDIQDQPAAIVKCKVGDGQVVLSGVHPEYSAHYSEAEKWINGDNFVALKEIERERRTLFMKILGQLNITACSHPMSL